jgi:hypothetical protein
MLVVPDPIPHGGSPTFLTTREFAAAWDPDSAYEDLGKLLGDLYPRVPMARYEGDAGVAELLFVDSRDPLGWYSPEGESGALLVQAGCVAEEPDLAASLVGRIPASAWRRIEGSILVPPSPISFYAALDSDEALENFVEPPIAPGIHSVEWANLGMDEDWLNVLRFRPVDS